MTTKLYIITNIIIQHHLGSSKYTTYNNNNKEIHYKYYASVQHLIPTILESPMSSNSCDIERDYSWVF